MSVPVRRPLLSLGDTSSPHPVQRFWNSIALVLPQSLDNGGGNLLHETEPDRIAIPLTRLFSFVGHRRMCGCCDDSWGIGVRAPTEAGNRTVLETLSKLHGEGFCTLTA